MYTLPSNVSIGKYSILTLLSVIARCESVSYTIHSTLYCTSYIVSGGTLILRYMRIRMTICTLRFMNRTLNFWSCVGNISDTSCPQTTVGSLERPIAVRVWCLPREIRHRLAWCCCVRCVWWSLNCTEVGDARFATTSDLLSLRFLDSSWACYCA